MIILAIFGTACAFISALCFINWGSLESSKPASILLLILSLVVLFFSGSVYSKGNSDTMINNLNEYEVVKVLNVEFTPGKEIFITIKKTNGTINLIEMDKVNFKDVPVNGYAKRVDNKLIPL